MVDVVITYETLFDVLRKEKSREELQQLPADFYGQIVSYLQKKKEDVAQAGGFHALGSQKAVIQFRNAQKILRELYERRERKILEMALNRARTESNLVDTSTLLPEERPFFEESAELLKAQKRKLLLPLLEGDLPEGVSLPVARPTETHDEAEEEVQRPAPAAREEEVDYGAVSLRERCPIRFTAAVPKFLGLKGEVHGPFEPGDTAELPGKIAAVLLKKKRVELAS